jgi:L-histidine N-alpha-methyltransferase
MPALAHVAIHPSQFPQQVRRDLVESLRHRKLNHKFLYDSLKQTRKWLALHQAYAPSRTDPDCEQTYERSFAAAAAGIATGQVHLIGLGCGGGQKDSRLLRLLRERGTDVHYTPVDVSAAMVLVAREVARALVPEATCSPLVCDLATAEDLADVFEQMTLERFGRTQRPVRLFTFFGMLPNFEPQTILPRLASLVGREAQLLVSANLAPGPDYAAGVRRILPLYDNELTRDWLMTFLLDLGVESNDGELRFELEEEPSALGLRRIAAHFQFRRAREIRVDEDRFEFGAGESIRLFFSYRHTPELVKTLLKQHGLEVSQQWVTKSGEEGVFAASQS